MDEAFYVGGRLAFGASTHKTSLCVIRGSSRNDSGLLINRGDRSLGGSPVAMSQAKVIKFLFTSPLRSTV